MAFENEGEAATREGYVRCIVRRVPIYGWGFRTLRTTGAQTVRFAADNIECALSAQRNPARETQRLRDAMHAITR